jgi:hypothetical protein
MASENCGLSKSVVTTCDKEVKRERPTLVQPDDGTALFPELSTRAAPLPAEEMAKKPQEVRKEFVEHFPMSVFSREPKVKIEREELIRLLKYENSLRLSEEYQVRYTNMRFNWHVEGEEYDAFAIDREIQVRALRDNGYHPDTPGDESLEAYQVACGRHILDPEVRECVVWMKYDKMRRGTLVKGAIYRNCDLVDMNTGEATTLSNFIPKQQDRPLILIGGSYT